MSTQAPDPSTGGPETREPIQLVPVTFFLQWGEPYPVPRPTSHLSVTLSCSKYVLPGLKMLLSTDADYHYSSESLLRYSQFPNWTTRVLMPVTLNPIFLRWLTPFLRQDLPKGHSPTVSVTVTPAPLSQLTPIPYTFVGEDPTCLGTKLEHVITTQFAKQKSSFIDWPHVVRDKLWWGFM